MTPGKEVLIVINPISGNGSSCEYAAEISQGLNATIISAPEIFHDPRNLTRLVNPDIPIATCTGDGTTLSVMRYLSLSETFPRAVIALGKPGIGGERVTARHLGTEGKSLSVILQAVSDRPGEVITSLQPWEVETDKDTRPFWWLVGVGNLAILPLLAEVEKARSEFRNYTSRVTVAFLRTVINQNFIGNENLVLTGMFPFLSHYFSTGPDGIPQEIEIINPGKKPLDQLIAMTIDLLSLNSSPQGPMGTISSRRLSSDCRLELPVPPDTQILIDSELQKGDNKIVVTNKNNFPPIPVVKLLR